MTIFIVTPSFCSFCYWLWNFHINKHNQERSSFTDRQFDWHGRPTLDLLFPLANTKYTSMSSSITFTNSNHIKLIVFKDFVFRLQTSRFWSLWRTYQTLSGNSVLIHMLTTKKNSLCKLERILILLCDSNLESTILIPQRMTRHAFYPFSVTFYGAEQLWNNLLSLCHIIATLKSSFNLRRNQKTHLFLNFQETSCFTSECNNVVSIVQEKEMNVIVLFYDYSFHKCS